MVLEAELQAHGRPKGNRPIFVSDCDIEGKVVLPDRIELSTSSLPMKCSTTELRQQFRRWNHANHAREWEILFQQGAQGASAGWNQPNRARCSFAPAAAFCRAASLTSTFLIRSAAKSCW